MIAIVVPVAVIVAIALVTTLVLVHRYQTKRYIRSANANLLDQDLQQIDRTYVRV